VTGRYRGGVYVHERIRAGAPGLLWVHGYTLDGSIFAPLWDLLPDYSHYALDLPGHGQTPALQHGWRLPEVARIVGELATGLDAHHLVGLSFGGMIALQAAMDFPSVFKTLCLSSPALAGGPQDPEAGECNLDLIDMARTRGVGPWLGERWMSCPPRIFAGLSRYPERLESIRQLVGRHAWSELLDESMAAVSTDHQTEAMLRRVTADTVIFVGEEDMEAFKRCAELIRRSIKHCRRIYVPAAGHLALLEEPETTSAEIGRLVGAVQTA